MIFAITSMCALLLAGTLFWGFHTGNMIIVDAATFKAKRLENPVAFWTIAIFNATMLGACIFVLFSLLK